MDGTVAGEKVEKASGSTQAMPDSSISQGECLKIECPIHRVEMQNYRCEMCYQDNVKKYEEHFKGMQVTLSIPYRPSNVLVDGVLQEVYHETKYVEYPVPTQFAEEIEKFIEDKVKEYESKCMCATCQKERQ